MGYGPKMPYYDYEKIFWRLTEAFDYFHSMLRSRSKYGTISKDEEIIFSNGFEDVPNLQVKVGQVLFDIADVMNERRGGDVGIDDIDLTHKITDHRQPLISRRPRPAFLAVEVDNRKVFEEIKAKNEQKAKDDHEAMIHYFQKENDQKVRIRIQKQKEMLAANREVRVDKVFKDKLKQKIIPRPEWFVDETMAEEPRDAKAESSTVLVEETVALIARLEEIIEDKKVHKEVRSEDWENDVVAFDSDMEETRLPQTTKTTRSLSESQSQPHWQTWSERLDQATTARALWQKEDSMLVKRPPQLEMTQEGEEGVQLMPHQPVTSVPKIAGYQRQPAFKLWIEEHDRKIAAGEIPKRQDYIWEAVERRQCGEEDDIIFYGQKYGCRWDQLYGSELNYVYAERMLRDPNVPSEPWQRKKDQREWLHTKHRHARVDEDRVKKLEEIKAKQRKYMEEFRRRETLDKERERQEEDRLRAQRNRDQKKLDRGEPLKKRLTPEEQKAARRKADAARKQKKRAEKTQHTTPEE